MSLPLKIGMIGGGTVGGGVYELIMGRLRHLGIITKICVKDINKARTFHVENETTSLVTDVNDVIGDDDVDVVIEVMGGTGLAKTVVLESLKRGKSVVTANKALLAEHLQEIQTAINNSSATVALEASVCGGIPIIQTLQSCYTGDEIHEIMGICNGTTNYMLGKMQDGADYAEILKEAQALGYAEADPTADVEGHDVRAKIALLAKLAFGKTIQDIDKNIPCRGISQLTTTDFEYAKLLQCTIKLVGTARRLSQNTEFDGPLSVYVAPTLIPDAHLLASIQSNGNAVTVSSRNMGPCSYTGPGAGRFPTANSVVADFVRIAKKQALPDPFDTISSSSSTTDLALDMDYPGSFYIRIPYNDTLGIVGKVGQLAESCGVSVFSLLQIPSSTDFCVMTDECKVSQIQQFCAALEQEPYVSNVPFWMPWKRME